MVVEWISSDVWLGQGSFQFTAEYQDHQATKVYINDGIQGMIRLWGTETANLEARKPFSICIASRFYNYSSSFPWPSLPQTFSELFRKRMEKDRRGVFPSLRQCPRMSAEAHGRELDRWMYLAGALFEQHWQYGLGNLLYQTAAGRLCSMAWELLVQLVFFVALFSSWVEAEWLSCSSARRVSFEAKALTISIFILAIVAAILDANFFSVNFIASESLGRAEQDAESA